MSDFPVLDTPMSFPMALLCALVFTAVFMVPVGVAAWYYFMEDDT